MLRYGTAETDEDKEKPSYRVVYNPPKETLALADPQAATYSHEYQNAVEGAKPVYKPEQADDSGDPDHLPARNTREYDDAVENAVPVYAGPNVVKNAHGSPVSVTGGGSELEKQQALLRAQEDYKPVNNNSRAAGAGLGAARGFQQGGVVGAIVGGLTGLFNKKADEEYANRRETGKTARRVSQEMTFADEASKRAYQDAQTYKDYNPVYKPEHIETGDGPMVFDPNHPQSAKPIYDDKGNRVKPKLTNQRGGVRSRWDENGKFYLEETVNGVPTGKRIPGSEDKTLDKKRTLDGNWVPQTVDEMARATAAERNYRHARDIKTDTQKAQALKAKQKAFADEADRQDRMSQKHSENAGKANDEINNLYTQLRALGTVSMDDPRRIELQDRIMQKRREYESLRDAAEKARNESEKARARSKSNDTLGLDDDNEQ